MKGVRIYIYYLVDPRIFCIKSRIENFGKGFHWWKSSTRSYTKSGLLLQIQQHFSLTVKNLPVLQSIHYRNHPNKKLNELTVRRQDSKSFHLLIVSISEREGIQVKSHLTRLPFWSQFHFKAQVFAQFSRTSSIFFILSLIWM